MNDQKDFRTAQSALWKPGLRARSRAAEAPSGRVTAATARARRVLSGLKNRQLFR
jgi:hypothetical protein